ncbi:MAG: hypothetical protein GF416_05495 [Candidatus Altiarchaeales archaeon]|nr:hypothetical protein [Candidatus Altiarchaeales archaeon]MBD3416572.1 hypothetical protein [Candidatus Altiarchaeales archaeon]
MDSEIKTLEYTVFVLGLLTLTALTLENSLISSEMPSGYAVLEGGLSSCCDDCSCPGPAICYSCEGCCWTGDCLDCGRGLGSDGMKLVYDPRVADGSSFSFNVVLSSLDDRRLLLELKLPNGFRSESENPVVVDLKAGEVEVVPFELHVVEGVAEKDHKVAAELVDSSWRIVSTAEGMVSVYWERK